MVTDSIVSSFRSLLVKGHPPTPVKIESAPSWYFGSFVSDPWASESVSTIARSSLSFDDSLWKRPTYELRKPRLTNDLSARSLPLYGQPEPDAAVMILVRLDAGCLTGGLLERLFRAFPGNLLCLVVRCFREVRAGVMSCEKIYSGLWRIVPPFTREYSGMCWQIARPSRTGDSESAPIFSVRKHAVKCLPKRGCSQLKPFIGYFIFRLWMTGLRIASGLILKSVCFTWVLDRAR